MPPVIQLRLTGVYLGLDRANHPRLDDKGLVWVRVERYAGRVTYSVNTSGGTEWLTTPEVKEAEKAFAEWERLADSGGWAG